MNRTVVYLSLAGGLALLAIVLVAPVKPARAPVTPTAPPPVAQGALSLEGRLSHPLIQMGRSDLFVTVDVSGKELPGQKRAPVNLAVVIDRSGSMSGEKLTQARQAALHLVQQLQDRDRLAVVHYGSDVRVLPGMNATAQNKERMNAFIHQIYEDGGTNIGGGLAAGRRELQRSASDFKVNRIILISDGQPTEGITDPGALIGLARGIRTDGVSVSAIGVGVDFNENLMAGIAESGAGAYAYLRDPSMLATIFQKDLKQAGTMVARNVELSFELPEGVEFGEVLGYPNTRAGRTVRVSMPDFSAGQTERVVVRLAVKGSNAGQRVDVAGLNLAWTDLVADAPGSASARLLAQVSDRPEEIAQRRDKDASLFATRAQAAANLARAADLLEKGDRKEADRYMAENESLFEGAKKVVGEEAVAEELASQREMRSDMSRAAAAPEVQHQVKSAKSRAMKDFGRMGSVY